MGIKTTELPHTYVEPYSYPRLLRSKTSPLIVLFVTPFKGTVVKESKAFPVGFTSDEWVPETFSEFVGAVTLENTP